MIIKKRGLLDILMNNKNWCVEFKIERGQSLKVLRT